jgi:hypothetical protein
MDMTQVKSAGYNNRKEKARYFAGLCDFFGFAFGVNGSGGFASIARNKASDRRFASAAGSKSSLEISAARSAGVGLRNVMFGV